MALHLLIHGSSAEEIKDNLNLAIKDWEAQSNSFKQYGAFGLEVFLRDHFEYEVVEMEYLSDKGVIKK